MAFFAISGLDVLKEDEVVAKETERTMEWIRRLYVVNEDGLAGFHGGNSLRDRERGHLRSRDHPGHIAMTYTALACYRILGGDARRDFDCEAILRGIKALQRPDGSFDSSMEGGENDMRFVFCAAAVCHMLGGFDRGMDVDRMSDYVRRSISYEGGIGQGPGLEAHGGSTYCAVASLSLAGRLETGLDVSQRRRLTRWCVMRLEDGFNGRPNKPADTCYSFWVGATLRLLSPFDDVPGFIGKSSGFVLDTQDGLVGGLSKWKDNSPDPLHTYLGLGGLALSGYPGLAEFDPALNVAVRTNKP